MAEKKRQESFVRSTRRAGRFPQMTPDTSFSIL
jgi:hypothetical protein